MDLQEIYNYLCTCDQDKSHPNLFWIYGTDKQKRDMFITTLSDYLKEKIVELPNIFLTNYEINMEELSYLEGKRVLLFKDFKSDESEIGWETLKILMCNNISVTPWKCAKLNLSLVFGSDEHPREYLHIPQNDLDMIQVIKLDK